eukprot:Hpha_TRINITY_DN34456_c0_g1::TRINITY_DN34456_c0_g1_i1::g.96183::m.96183
MAEAIAEDLARMGPPPTSAATREEMREYYGRSVWPVYEEREEEGINQHLKACFGKDVDISTAGHLVELAELVHQRASTKLALGADVDTIGGQDDTEAAAAMWRHYLDDSPEDLAQEFDARFTGPIRDPLRKFDVVLIRAEFDQGPNFAVYEHRVLQRQEEWAGWLTRLQRCLHRRLEDICGSKGIVQRMAPPSLARLQAAADAAELGLASQGELMAPPPVEDQATSGTAHQRVFRPVSPERPVTPDDALPCMPTVVLSARIVPAKRKKGKQGGSGVQLSFSMRVTKDACFSWGKSFAKALENDIRSLGAPPAVCAFSALFRVDPREFTEHQEKLRLEERPSIPAGEVVHDIETSSDPSGPAIPSG